MISVVCGTTVKGIPQVLVYINVYHTVCSSPYSIPVLYLKNHLNPPQILIKRVWWSSTKKIDPRIGIHIHPFGPKSK